MVNSYENCAFVGTDAAEAGHMQGEMIGNYLLENYDAVDLNGDGTISYVCSRARRATRRPSTAPSIPSRTPTPS